MSLKSIGFDAMELVFFDHMVRPNPTKSWARETSFDKFMENGDCESQAIIRSLKPNMIFTSCQLTQFYNTPSLLSFVRAGAVCPGNCSHAHAQPSKRRRDTIFLSTPMMMSKSLPNVTSNAHAGSSWPGGCDDLVIVIVTLRGLTKSGTVLECDEMRVKGQLSLYWLPRAIITKSTILSTVLFSQILVIVLIHLELRCVSLECVSKCTTLIFFELESTMVHTSNDDVCHHKLIQLRFYNPS